MTNDLHYLSIMKRLTEKVLLFHEELKKMDKSSFKPIAYCAMQDAIAWNVFRIGEALESNEFSAEVKEEFDTIDCSRIRSFKDQYWNRYHNMSFDTVATIVEEDLPLLLELLKTQLKTVSFSLNKDWCNQN